MSKQKTKNFIDQVQINDVFLRSSLGSVEKGFPPSSLKVSDLVFYKKHIIASSERVHAAKSDNLDLLHVLIQFGIRFAEKESEEDIKVTIEADFVVEYLINQEMSKEEVDNFVFEYASTHAWPYWVEYLNSQIKRMRLPRFSLPVFDVPNNKIENL